MSLFKFEPTSDITTQQLALIVRSFLLVMHGEDPGNNLEMEGSVVEFLITLDPSISNHFDSVQDYD